MNRLVSSLGIGTALQVAMVVLGHFVPSLQQYGLFPIVGTLLGLLTGVMAGGQPVDGGTPLTPSGDAGPHANSPLLGALTAGAAGAIGSLVSTLLGDVPLGNVLIAGGSTLVMGAIGTAVRNRMRPQIEGVRRER